MKEIGNELEIDDNVSDYIFKKILPEKEYGARPIGRAIQKEIENAITDYILENECEGKRLVVSIKNDKVEVSG